MYEKKSIKLFGGIVIIIVIAVLVYQSGTTVNTKAIPVYESTTNYPELTLDSLTDMASYILLAEVKEIGEPIQEEMPVSVTEKHLKRAAVHNSLVMPVVLKVQKTIKGNVIDKEFIYYVDDCETHCKFAVYQESRFDPKTNFLYEWLTCV